MTHKNNIKLLYQFIFILIMCNIAKHGQYYLQSSEYMDKIAYRKNIKS